MSLTSEFEEKVGELLGKFCDDYCKYHAEIKAKGSLYEPDYTRMLEEHCDKCPMTRI